MLRFLGYFVLGFVAQIAFLVLFVMLLNVLDIRNPGVVGEVVFYAYLWPLFFLPTTGGSHGGELFFSPFTAILYAFVFAMLVSIWKSRSRKN